MKTSVFTVCSLLLAQSTFCHAQWFLDDFNRPDSTVVGNGWLSTSGNVGGNLLLENGAVTTTSSDGGAGIYRPFPFTGPLAVSATVTDMNGYYSLLRYDNFFTILNDGALFGGYGIEIARGDENYSDSRVNLYDNGNVINTVYSSFQYGPQINVNITFAPDGSLTGTITEGTEVFNFSFGPRAIQSTGNNFSWGTGFPDSRAATFTYPTLDNLSLVQGLFTVSQKSLPTYGICPAPRQSKDSLVFITHGWIPNYPGQESIYLQKAVEFVNSTSNEVFQYLAANSGLGNWQVEGYLWTEQAETYTPGGALGNAEQEGKMIGDQIVSQGTWTHIHFIAHSAGAGLIQKATEQIHASLTNTTIHCTFLDAYDGVIGEKAYEYGTEANWADSYFVRDAYQVAGVTGRILPNAYNVDVTALDPKATTQWYLGPGSGPLCFEELQSNHGWPNDFYSNSIAGAIAGNLSSIPNGSYYDGFGFPLSEEAGQWSYVLANYTEGNGVSYSSVTNLGAENGTCIPSYSLPPGYIGTMPSFSVASTIKSITGTLQTFLGSILLGTGSPVWVATIITDTNMLNYVSFDAKFTSAAGADGLLSIYWDTNMIGLLDEAAVQPGFHHYNLSFQNTAPTTSHLLGFRIDPFTSTQSTLILTNIITGCVGVSQPFSLSVSASRSNGLLVYQLTGQPATYYVQTSGDLVNWTNIAILANTNGTVNFIDQGSTNYPYRFYRATAPTGLTP